MTFYNKQIILIKDEVYHREYLYEQAIRAKRFIDSNFSESITLDDIAGQACFSKFHFIRLFKSIYGKTPHQYLTEVRIEKAKQLLQADASIADVCFAVGFDSVSSFKALFKRHTRWTPASFKQRKIKRTPEWLPFSFLLQKSNFQDRDLKLV